MRVRAVTLTEYENGNVVMGVKREDTDPYTKTEVGTIELVLPKVLSLLTEAEAQWGKSLKNPAYKAPEPPKPRTTAPAAKTGSGTTTDELPLLQGQDKAPAGTPSTPLEATASTEEGEGETEEAETETVEAKVETTAESPMPQDVQKVEPVGAAPVAGAPAQGAPAATPPPPVSTGTPPPPTPGITVQAPVGGWQYFLDDDRGPYESVQEAMDEMGLDKATRPSHNRWDRLSTALKNKIIRREKKA